MVADQNPVSRVQRLKLALKLGYACAQLLKFRCLLQVLRLQIGMSAFQRAVLGRDEPKALLENRRRAVFVDQRLQQLQHHVVPRLCESFAQGRVRACVSEDGRD